MELTKEEMKLSIEALVAYKDDNKKTKYRPLIKYNSL